MSRALRPLGSLLLVCVGFIAPVWLFLHAGEGDARRSQRISPPDVQLTTAELAAAARLPAFDEAVPVLAAGTVDDEPGTDRIGVEPFARTVALLQAAGVHTVSAKQLAGWSRGYGRLPPRPLLLTFDGNAASSWRAADPILAAAGMRAVLCVDPSRLGASSTYYLRPGELRELTASGRWELGLLLARSNGRPGALSDGLATLSRSGLPRPQVLCRADGAVDAAAPAFRLVLSDAVPPRFASREDVREAAPRLELRDSPAGVLDELAAAAPRPPAGAPLQLPQRWQGAVGAGRPAHGVLVLSPEPRTWQEVAYEPAASALWEDYEIDVRIAGLTPAASAAVLVRNLDAGRVATTVSSSAVTVRTQQGPGARTVLRARIPFSASHRLTLRVQGTTFALAVDGAALPGVELPASLARGGLALGAWRSAKGGAPIRFDSLRVREAGTQTAALGTEQATPGPAPQPRSVGAREEPGSTAGPPPRPAQGAGAFALALLYLAFALGAVALVGAVLQAAARLKHRSRPGPPLSARRPA